MISEWVDQFNVTVRSLDDRPDDPEGDIVYVVKDIFTTRDGSWEATDLPGGCPQWARDAYLKPWGAPDYFDDAGADHNLFALVLDVDGNPIKGKGIIFWSDGFDKLGDSAYEDYTMRETKQGSGWANIPVFNHYAPDLDEVGAWCWAPFGPAEVVQGGGLPWNRHISTFAVWQAVPRDQLEGPEEPETPELPEYPEGEAGIRQKAWDTVGVNYNPEAAFSRYAREHGLGIPLTNEFDIHEFRAQGFVGGIVYARVGEWDQVSHIEW